MGYWEKITSRGNIDDRRGAGLQLLAGGGLGIVSLGIIVVLNLLSGGSIPVEDILQQLQSSSVSRQTDANHFTGEDSYEQFASKVVGSNNDMWNEIFAKNGASYKPPTLVLFRDLTSSGCGYASSQVGPHYCPNDQTIYLDETFFNELQTRFGASGGDVAEAYVIAHEMGHHAQNELGIMAEVQKEQGRGVNDNALAIKLELQADCFAGLWAFYVQDLGVFEAGEIKEAIDAAAAVGDDRVQSKVPGRISPENWTHGSSEQRVEWFNKGYSSGNLSTCNTFREF